MADPVKAVELVQRNNPVRSSSSSNQLEERVSRDVVIALMGPVGSGLPAVSSMLREKLIELNYTVHIIKISEFIKKCLEDNKIEISSEENNNRYYRLQAAGNSLRKTFKTEILAEYAINQIGRIRVASTKDASEFGKNRQAFLVDQLKHQDEINLLRLVYRKNLFVLGVMSQQGQRESRLVEEGIQVDIAKLIIERDRKEPEKWGQQLEKAFKLADYYLRNPFGKPDLLNKQVERFISLVHGSNSLAPSQHEHAMYIAYASGIKSACLSRQVGAAICDTNGRIIAVGANDVPSPGGGLYTYSVEEKPDHRCYKNKFCENSREKTERLKNISESVERELNSLILSLTEEQQEIFRSIDINEWSKKLSERAKENSGIPDLIEFSRAVHAEMDALISLSRSGGGTTQNGTLYTTTFPCHNCARHIIAAGIKKVFYIEPYEKSLALASHSDAIDLVDFEEPDTPSEHGKSTKVQFIHFAGVSPRVFNDLFSREDGRKNPDGTFKSNVNHYENIPAKVTKEYRDSYLDFEKKIAGIFESDFPSQ